MIIYLFQWRSQDSQHACAQAKIKREKIRLKRHCIWACRRARFLHFSRIYFRIWYCCNKLTPIRNAASCLCSLFCCFLESHHQQIQMFSDSVLTVPNREIFLERIFFNIGNSRRNIELLVTGYVINYLTADCHMPNRKEGKWLQDFNALGKCLLWIPEPGLSLSCS